MTTVIEKSYEDYMLSKTLAAKISSIEDAEKYIPTATARHVPRTGGRKFEIIIEGKKHVFIMRDMLHHIEKLAAVDKKNGIFDQKSLKNIATHLDSIDKVSKTFSEASKLKKNLTKLRRFFGNLFHKKFDKTKLKAWTELTVGEVSPPPIEKKNNDHEQIPHVLTIPKPGQIEAEEEHPHIIQEKTIQLEKMFFSHIFKGEAQLLHLKIQLKKASPIEKEAIKRQIIKLENNDLRRILTISQDLFINDATEIFTRKRIEALSRRIGKTRNETIALFLMQSYFQKLQSQFSLSVADYMDPTGNVNEAKFDEWLFNMLDTQPDDLGKIKEEVEKEAIEALEISVEEVTSCFEKLYIDGRMAKALTFFGQDLIKEEPSNFAESAVKIFDDNKILHFRLGQNMWRHFSIGENEPYKDPESQWKVFVNPRSSEFLSTLDRTLRVLKKHNISVEGKIVADDTIKRHSDFTVLQDPCEPKFFLYFRGPHGEEEFKRAMKILEKEFKDADLIAAPQGQRDRNGKMVPQWGPSFTKNRNNLFFYTQGGFTESGRDHYLALGMEQLAQQFEGENFYLHKGYKDPLESLPVGTYSLKRLLDYFEKNADSVIRPLQLIKLQNIYNRLAEENPPSDLTIKRMKQIETILEKAVTHLTVDRQRSVIQMFNYNNGMGAVQDAFSKKLLNKIGQSASSLDKNKGRIEAQLEYVEKEAQEQIKVIDAYINKIQVDGNLSDAQFLTLLNDIPVTLRDYIFGMIGPEVKESVFQKMKENYKTGIRNFLSDHRSKLNPENIKILEECLQDTKPIEESLDKKYLRFRDNKIDFFYILLGSRFASINLDFYFSKFSIYGSNVESQIQAKTPPITYSDLQIDQATLLSHLQLFKGKLESVQQRQAKRLQALRKGEMVSIPVYFHTAPFEAVSSIASTGVETTHASKGTGAYVSTTPELTYGAVSFGFPEYVGFISESAYSAEDRGHTVLGGKEAVWNAFKEMLEIQPGTLQLRHQFLNAVQVALRENLEGEGGLSFKEKVIAEAYFLKLINHNLVFRISNDQTLNFGYRKQGNVILIKDDNDFMDFIKSNLQLCKKFNLSENFSQTFKAAFRYDKPTFNDNFTIAHWPKEKIKSTVVGIDDDLKEYYTSVFKSVETFRKDKTLVTLGQVKENLKQSGFDLDDIEFVPSFEQYLERDLRIPIQEVPRSWKPENH